MGLVSSSVFKLEDWQEVERGRGGREVGGLVNLTSLQSVAAGNGCDRGLQLVMTVREHAGGLQHHHPFGPHHPAPLHQGHEVLHRLRAGKYQFWLT